MKKQDILFTECVRSQGLIFFMPSPSKEYGIGLRQSVCMCLKFFFFYDHSLLPICEVNTREHLVSCRHISCLILVIIAFFHSQAR